MRLESAYVAYLNDPALSRIHAVVTQIEKSQPADRRLPWGMMLLIAALAIAMGLPSVRGGFVGGDDYILVRDHVLVNHPSLKHAAQLFMISHRDLYQPLPLLTFSAEFAIAYQLNLFEGGRAAEKGAWLFHLDNVLLHAVNAVLVWLVLRRLTKSRYGEGVAAIAAILFAVHPLQVEVVAWINGRMMLLSTLFALASLLAFDSWLECGRKRWWVLTILFVICCAISKVRVGLPILLLIAAWAHGRKFDRRLWFLWIVSTVAVAAFALVNIKTTAGAEMFAGGAEKLQGPRLVRVLLALACYWQHFVWPVGLSSFYPAPEVVHWTDIATLRAALIVAVGLCVLAWACYVSHDARWGTLWFFATIASTLPFVPARNLLAADRYIYLPIVGMLWLFVSAAAMPYQRWLSGRPALRRRAVVTVVVAALVVALVPVSWHVTSFYKDAISKAERLVQLFPDTPRMWNILGWSHYTQGKELQEVGKPEEATSHFEEAVRCALTDLKQGPPRVRGDSYQLMAMSNFRLGRIDEAIEGLRHAMEVGPQNGMAPYRLGTILQDQGRIDEAVETYERALERSPRYVPLLVHLAACYRALGRPQEARAMYEQALQVNAYDITATLGLAELNIEENTAESLRRAHERLRSLLDWAPDHIAARTNLGVVLANLGQHEKAIDQYRTVLQLDPNAATATVNLALLLQAVGDEAGASAAFRHAASITLDSFEQAVAVHEFFAARGMQERSEELWLRFAASHPESLAGQAATALITGDFAAIPELAESLSAESRQANNERRRLVAALEVLDRYDPDNPWLHCLVARLSVADGKIGAARVFLDLCERSCGSPACTQYAAQLRALIDSD
jgi:tetratricopeptide (TPR) repeat protein